MQIKALAGAAVARVKAAEAVREQLIAAGTRLDVSRIRLRESAEEVKRRSSAEKTMAVMKANAETFRLRSEAETDLKVRPLARHRCLCRLKEEIDRTGRNSLPAC